MNAVARPAMLGRGLYPLTEAARLTQLEPQVARRWAVGNRYVHQGERRSSSGVMPLELPELAGKQDLTFAELLTLRMVRTFREVKLGLPTIKQVARKAAEEYGVRYPFVSKRFRTDGRKVFIELGRDAAANDRHGVPSEERRLIEVLSGQAQFAEVVEPSLFANLDWQDEWQAARWWPAGKAGGVILDPTVLFGAPRVDETGVPTAVLANAFKAEGGGETAIEAVADWHGLTPKQVRQAVEYELEWLPRAA